MGKVNKFPIKTTFCQWCWTRVKVRADFDEDKYTAYCGEGCRDAEWLFRLHFSDENILERRKEE